ncbi:hypothetical protein C2E23DRAFT_835582 [Lenzites betulinus]|nr:hypothetical protein C2E23DRAFT_835582 [Lenzites betulinus]
MLAAQRLARPRPAAARHARSLATQKPASSAASSSPPPPFAAQPSTSSPSTSTQPPPPQQTWLSKTIKQSPAAKQAFLTLAGLLGYGTAKQYAGRRAYNFYSELCIPRPDDEAAFWRTECDLPPTFQSWFTVTNLHVWLLTVRLRALPPPHGTNYVQGLIDHFFIDVEDRVRAVLQPVSPNSYAPPQNLVPYTRATAFYRIANRAANAANVEAAAAASESGGAGSGKMRPRGRAPESLVSRQMKIFKEQWAGMGMSLDLGLVRSDTELAAAVWRNLLGARGARGIAYTASTPSSSAGAPAPAFRRTVNFAGGKVEKLSKIAKLRGGLEAEERRDDGSGVHDYPPSQADRYVAYPERMAAVVEYIRRELVRLEQISDADILGQGVIGTESLGLDALRFGPVRRADGIVAALKNGSALGVAGAEE